MCNPSAYSFCLSPSLFLNTPPPQNRYLHLLCTGSYVAQSIILSCTINGLLSSTKLHPLLSESLPLPLLCASLISILVACNSYPHYLYAGKPTMLFLICVGYDALQVTMATLVIYSIAVIMMYD